MLQSAFLGVLIVLFVRLMDWAALIGAINKALRWSFPVESFKDRLGSSLLPHCRYHRSFFSRLDTCKSLSGSDDGNARDFFQIKHARAIT